MTFVRTLFLPVTIEYREPDGDSTRYQFSNLELNPQLDDPEAVRTARRLGRENPVTVHATFLGAHALPPEFKDRSDEYIDLVIEAMLPAVAAANRIDSSPRVSRPR